MKVIYIYNALSWEDIFQIYNALAWEAGVKPSCSAFKRKPLVKEIQSAEKQTESHNL